MASQDSVVLNIPTTTGKAVAAILDAANLEHQQVVIQTQSGASDPVNVSLAAPLPVAGNVSDGTADPSTPGVKVAGVYQSAAPTLGSGQRNSLLLDASGNLKVNIAAGASAGGTSSAVGAAVPSAATAAGFSDGANLRLGVVDGSGFQKVNIAASSAAVQVAGTIADGSADSGNSVKIGGTYNSVAPTVASGQRYGLQIDANGFLKVNIAAGAAAGGTSSTFGAAVPAVGTAIGATDGTNMQLVHVDGSGNLKVNIAAGGVPAGQDNTGFTAGTTQGLPALAVFNDGIGALTSTNQGALRCTADRKLYVAPGASVSGGWTPVSVVGAASVNLTTVKASPGQVGFMQVTNQDTTWAYVKLYDVLAGGFSGGVTSPKLSLGIPPGGGFVLPGPVAFATGIYMSITSGIALLDQTALPNANKVSVNIGYA